MFAIDTGAPADTFDERSLVPDWFRDMHGDADTSRLFHDYAYHMIGAMQNPKQWKTVRKHILHDWGFLRALSQHHPDVFDEVLAAYAERWQDLA
jgi:hypothetical protein